MKKVFWTMVVLGVMVAPAAADTIASWNMDGASKSDRDDPAFAANDSLLAGMTSALLHHSDPDELRSGDDAYSAIDWDDTTDLAGAITKGNYYKVNLDAGSNTMDFEEIRFYVENSSNPTTGKVYGWAITDSSDNQLATGTVAGYTQTYVTADLTSGAYDGQTAEFRLYAWDAGSGELTNGDRLWIGDAYDGAPEDGILDVRVLGEIPEPATLGLLVCGGMGLLLKRRRRIA